MSLSDDRKHHDVARLQVGKEAGPFRALPHTLTLDPEGRTGMFRKASWREYDALLLQGPGRPRDSWWMHGGHAHPGMLEGRATSISHIRNGDDDGCRG